MSFFSRRWSGRWLRAGSRQCQRAWADASLRCLGAPPGAAPGQPASSPGACVSFKWMPFAGSWGNYRLRPPGRSAHVSLRGRVAQPGQPLAESGRAGTLGRQPDAWDENADVPHHGAAGPGHLWAVLVVLTSPAMNSALLLCCLSRPPRFLGLPRLLLCASLVGSHSAAGLPRSWLDSCFPPLTSPRGSQERTLFGHRVSAVGIG